MSPPQKTVEDQRRLVERLMTVLYSNQDPASRADDLRQLAKAQRELEKLESAAAPQKPDTAPASAATSTSYGRFLGPETTGLEVKPTVHMPVVPTGIYHLLDPETDPLISVVIKNISRDYKPKRIRVKAKIEALSAQTVRTVEIASAGETKPIKLSPILLPERARRITEVQRGTLHLQIDDLDGKPESHDTFPLLLLARNSSFNAAKDPTGKPIDLSRYYGAWVTPNVDTVYDLLREAAALSPDAMIYSYQRGKDGVVKQVAAIFEALKKRGLTYVNSVIDFGSPTGRSTQRTRLPRESLERRSANCIDGAVLFASLLEAASLNAALLLVPGHALVGWETADGSGEWQYLETTMIGSHDFAAACKSGQKQYDEASEYYPGSMRVHKLATLRADGIYPME